MKNPKPGDRVRCKFKSGSVYDGVIVSLDERGNVSWRIDGSGVSMIHPSHLIRLRPQRNVSWETVVVPCDEDGNLGELLLYCQAELVPLFGKRVRVTVKEIK